MRVDPNRSVNAGCEIDRIGVVTPRRSTNCRSTCVRNRSEKPLPLSARVNGATNRGSGHATPAIAMGRSWVGVTLMPALADAPARVTLGPLTVVSGSLSQAVQSNAVARATVQRHKARGATDGHGHSSSHPRVRGPRWRDPSQIGCKKEVELSSYGSLRRCGDAVPADGHRLDAIAEAGDQRPPFRDCRLHRGKLQ